MAAVKSPLSEAAQKVTGEALQGALVDLVDLGLYAKQAHWNLVGPRFKTIHEHLDEIVDLARTAQDDVAERAVAIGVNPDGRSRTVADRTEIQQLEPGYLNDEKVVLAVTGTLFEIIGRFRERIAATDEPDPVSQDLLIGITAELEKIHWMFQAQA
ncbi:DNA starvation/stationary phase protection protein [Actinomadura logoneensis]|uniref:DNA starvation/stationary phase protection protein n=1 Tax=Actinomadura logoneensis TaxID=2293572 RepID=A0A372JBI4_9ACTN|nr:DNA starvation/stationary phase protection protein [Actinomadura logoneensis]RFU37330.1 DNA starvation/stationary phase protection protein [Actinomadura logoneensis]